MAAHYNSRRCATVAASIANGCGFHAVTRESAIQLLATLHLSARDRFRLILQRVMAEQREDGADQEDTRLVGSLLFTHERSLTRRVYGGVTWARNSGTGTPGLDNVEVFFKIQSGMSTATGARW